MSDKKSEEGCTILLFATLISVGIGGLYSWPYGFLAVLPVCLLLAVFFGLADWFLERMKKK